jgi:PAS domain S-box-containing protein
VSTTKNITERKQLEEQLRESEEKFRAISTSATDAIILVDTAGKVCYWNPAAEKMFGYTDKEIMGKDLAEEIVPQDARELFSVFLEEPAESVAQFNGKPLDLTARRKDGIVFPMELSVSLLTFGNEPYLLGLIRDVSERKKMEAELKQERDMLEGVTSSIGAGLSLISKDYKILWVNNFFKKFGPPNIVLEGKVCYSTFNTLDAVCPDCGVKKVFDGASYDAHEYSALDPQGTPFWTELIVTPVKDNAGNVVAALELTVNITEKKLMQQKLAEYSQKLEKLVDERTEQLKQTQAKLVKSERLAAIGELAGMVGHDLRNPLTSIKGAAYYLKSKGATERVAMGKEMLETIDSAIEYSNKIVNDLLEYSQDLQLDFTETSPKLLLANVLALIKLPEKIQLTDATKDKPVIKVDTGKINRVFVNLIKNASDAMPNGGTLTITSKGSGDNVEIAFKDNGVGMSKETVSKLWTPLFTTKAKGMGFGLVICKRIVEAHSGKITAESAIGKGTTFTVTLPVNPKPSVTK